MDATRASSSWTERVPNADLIEPVRGTVLSQIGQADVDLARLSLQLSALNVLGPATLAYLDGEEFAAADAHIEGESVSANHPDVRTPVASVDEQDADECGLDEITSEAFVTRRGGRVLAAAGYRSWLNMVAHVSVLTAPGHRGRGLARLVASAAVADALAKDLLSQWRARPEPSRRVARALGFRELGSQVNIHIRC
ncbi:GNAT family N-acetyltransferase [Nonomuraea fuscirosea]|uniref:GNAT family N-acetyltransferase n=1 Tax=Nonomuraea fuscirosea TaxID=1291556 RepID=UPI001FE59E85|nr:GNAT family N-acetyltransferase [Nonomuraea fuscirosea]